MEEFKPRETEITGNVKKQVKHFIENSIVLDENTKKALLEELGENWFDERFSAKAFIEDISSYAVSQWNKNNFKLVELWQQVAINNAKTHNKPFKVANETIASFKSKFNL